MIVFSALLLAMALASAPAAQPDALALDGRIPSAYLACADKFLAGRSSSPAFSCTQSFYEVLPGAQGSTYEINQAMAKAVDAGRAYRRLLLSRVEKKLGLEGENGYVQRSYLESVVKQRQDAADSFCGLKYVFDYPGSIRGPDSGSCEMRSIDRLVDDLIAMTPGG